MRRASSLRESVDLVERGMLKRTLIAANCVLALCALPVWASGGASGTKVTFKTQGELGEVVNNPYDLETHNAVG